MQVQRLSPFTGIYWLRDGWRLFLRQPLGLPAMVVVYVLGLTLPALIPGLGVPLAALLTPFLSLGLLASIRQVDQGHAPSVMVFAEPFRNTQARRALLQLGVVHLIAQLLVNVAVSALIGEEAKPQLAAGEAPKLQDLPWKSFSLSWLLSLPVTLLLWFAPALAGWHGLSATKAMFGSAVGCLRNLPALIVFVLSIGVSMMVAVAAVALVLPILGAAVAKSLASILAAPAALLMFAIVEAGIYAMYRSVFMQTPPPAEVEPR